MNRYGGSLILDNLIPFVVLVIGFFPLSFTLVVALESFVGEKERGTIEPLLSSPLEDSHMYLGKLLVGITTPLVFSLCIHWDLLDPRLAPRCGISQRVYAGVDLSADVCSCSLDGQFCDCDLCASHDDSLGKPACLFCGCAGGIPFAGGDILDLLGK